MLNIRWGWSVFRRAFREDARSLKDWYLRVLPATIRRMGWPAAFMVIIILASVWLGTTQVSRFPALAKNTDISQATGGLKSLAQAWPLFSLNPVLGIWWQNVRALLISVVLGVFSFGVLGVMPAMLTFGLLGFLMNLVSANGITTWQYLVGFILPHGIVEIPAVVLAGAAMLRMGAILATPTPGKTIGEVWLSCLADWAKIMVGAVIPMLLVAAAVEAWLTPRLAILVTR